MEKAAAFLVKQIRDDHQVTERYAVNYASVCAALTMFAPEMFASEAEEKCFLEYIVRHVHDRQTESDSEHVSISFVRDLLTLKTTKPDFPAHAFCVREFDGQICVAVHMPTAHAYWMQFLRSQGSYMQGWSKQAIQKSLQTIGWKSVTCSIAGKNWSCIRTPSSEIKNRELQKEIDELNIISMTD
jgi:hypothetical protein